MSLKASPACKPGPEDPECSEILYIDVNILVTIRNSGRAGVMPLRDLAVQGGLRGEADAAVGRDCAGHGS